jgi:ATP phosphoribosyltransferase regulatory subunit
MVHSQIPDVAVTVDPCESHGFEYKSGIGFAVFARGSQNELGRGGRYLVEHPDGSFEDATGFSVYLDSVMGALETPEARPLLYLPNECSAKVGKECRIEGWRTIQGLTDEADASKEARRLGCSHIFLDNSIVAL